MSEPSQFLPSLFLTFFSSLINIKSAECERSPYPLQMMSPVRFELLSSKTRALIQSWYHIILSSMRQLMYAVDRKGLGVAKITLLIELQVVLCLLCKSRRMSFPKGLLTPCLNISLEFFRTYSHDLSEIDYSSYELTNIQLLLRNPYTIRSTSDIIGFSIRKKITIFD